MAEIDMKDRRPVSLRSRIMPLALALILQAGPAWAESQPQRTGKEWREAALADVRAGYRLFVENHPGIYNEDDPGFPAQLAAARTAGLQAAQQVKDRAGYTRALGAFSRELEDFHARFEVPGIEHKAKLQWPGFHASWRGNGLFVHAAPQETRVKTGDAIVSCDGQPVRDWLDGLFAGEEFFPSQPSSWWDMAPSAFIVDEAGDRAPARRCTFRSADGREQDIALHWRKAPDGVAAKSLELNYGAAPEISLSEARPGLFVIGMPTFHSGPDQVTAYQALFKAIEARHDDLAKARAIILDLRYNGGGSSIWSTEIAKRLWGGDAVASRASSPQVWWRASAGNTDHVHQLIEQLGQAGQLDYVAQFKPVVAGMDEALSKDDAFFIQPSTDAAPRQRTPSSLSTPVFVITQARCGSSCLTAIDTFKGFANVRLIGSPTAADTVYMEVRHQNLPSGPGELTIPTKMYVGRARGSGQFYTPDIPMDGLDWSIGAFLDRIEIDLASR